MCCLNVLGREVWDWVKTGGDGKFSPNSPQKGCDHVTECVHRRSNVVIVVVVVVITIVLMSIDYVHWSLFIYYLSFTAYDFLFIVHHPLFIIHHF